MSIAEKLSTIAENEQKVYNAGYNIGKSEGYQHGESVGYGIGYGEGTQAEYAAYWDEFQKNGSRTHYGHSWACSPFTPKLFAPKYDMYCTSCERMFAYIGNTNATEGAITNLKSRLEELGVKFNTANCTNFTLMFYTNKIVTHLPELDCSKASKLEGTFYNATALVSIDKLKLREDGVTDFYYSTTSSRTFGNCVALRRCIFEGVIGNSIYLAQCPLDKDSLISVINCLSTTVTNKPTCALKKTAVNAIDWSTTEWGSWEALVATKSDYWTITLG